MCYCTTSRCPCHRESCTNDVTKVLLAIVLTANLSRISRDRLVSAAAGAAITLTALWLGLITIAAAAIILRA